MRQKAQFHWDDPLLLNQQLTDEERMVRDAAAAYCQDKLQPRILEAFRHEAMDSSIFREMGELGLLGPTIPEQYGGPGLNYVSYGLIAREVERVDSGYRSMMSVQSSLVMVPIYEFGNEETKQKYLPKLATGEWIGCFGLTEPNHGSDPASMVTRARKVEGGYSLTGSKMWITNAQIADLAIVWAKTGSDAASVCGFIVERDRAGFSVGNIPHKLSMRASETGVLYLEEVRVPEANRLPEAMGLKAPLQCLNNARSGIAFGVLGAARACLEGAIQYTRERQQFDVPIASKQLVQLDLADVATEIVKASVLSLHFARLKDAGQLQPAQVSLWKRNNCRVALEAARKSRALLGGNGITGDYHIMRHLMNLETTFTYEGTDHIHALSIGRALTGLSAF